MPKVTVQNAYPSPLFFNFDTETDDGEHVTRQVVLNPGEAKQVSKDDWEKIKDHDAVTRALDDRRMAEDPKSDQIDRNQRELARSLLDPSLIEHWSKEARTTDVDEVGLEHEQDAMAAIRDHLQNQRSVQGRGSPRIGG
jgi:hypothetical protein